MIPTVAWDVKITCIMLLNCSLEEKFTKGYKMSLLDVHNFVIEGKQQLILTHIESV